MRAHLVDLPLSDRLLPLGLPSTQVGHYLLNDGGDRLWLTLGAVVGPEEVLLDSLRFTGERIVYFPIVSRTAASAAHANNR